MAGDWIKMRVDLADDPAVISVAARLAIDEDTVVGKLHRMWSWFDKHTRDGNASRVTAAWINRFVRCDGFGEALSEVGWLAFSAEGVQIPNFLRHNGQTAKARALTAKRVAKSRSCNADDVTEPVDEIVTDSVSNTVTAALPEKRREEKKREESKTSPSSSQSAQQPVRSSTGVPATWAEAAEAMKRLKVSRRQEAIEAAKANRFVPPQVLALIDYLLSPAAKCESPAGALCDRLGTADAAEWNADEGWPWSKPVGSEATSIYQPSPNVERLHQEKLDREKIERKRQFAQELERCELAHGDRLNAMSESEILELIATDAPATARIILRDFQAKGRDSPHVRPELLRLLEAVEEKNGLEVAS